MNSSFFQRTVTRGKFLVTENAKCTCTKRKWHVYTITSLPHTNAVRNKRFSAFTHVRRSQATEEEAEKYRLDFNVRISDGDDVVLVVASSSCFGSPIHRSSRSPEILLRHYRCQLNLWRSSSTKAL